MYTADAIRSFLVTGYTRMVTALPEASQEEGNKTKDKFF